VRDSGQRQRQHLYRQINEHIRGRIEQAYQTMPAAIPVEFLCECGRPRCTATIALTQPQWDALAQRDSQLIVAAEHQDALDGLHLMAKQDRFLIVAPE
jgi:hypothetical protein